MDCHLDVVDILTADDGDTLVVAGGRGGRPEVGQAGDGVLEPSFSDDRDFWL